MCGYVSGLGKSNIIPTVLTSLAALEHANFDTASMLVLTGEPSVADHEWLIKKDKLEVLISANLNGKIAIGNLIWDVNENIQPHIFINSDLILVKNGIINNYEILRSQLTDLGIHFTSESDAELIGQLISFHLHSHPKICEAIHKAFTEIDGFFSITLIQRNHPEKLIAIQKGSSITIGQNENGTLVSSSFSALISMADKFVHLEEGDVAEITQDKIIFYDMHNKEVQRKSFAADNIKKSKKSIYPNLLLKEIFTQPDAALETLQGRLTHDSVLMNAFGKNAVEVFKGVHRVQIVTTERSYQAGLIAKAWLEEIAGVPCQMELASEYRARDKIMEPHKLFVTISRTGEEENILSSLRLAKNWGYVATLAICNTQNSSVVNESDFVFLSGGFVETNDTYPKSFITQLIGLLLLSVALGRYHRLSRASEQTFVKALRVLPKKVQEVLSLAPRIQEVAKELVDKQEFTILGGGLQFPIAREGAIKLKDYSSSYAEAYPAGEFQHYFPASLTTSSKAIIVLAPGEELDNLLPKLKTMSENGHDVIIFTDRTIDQPLNDKIKILKMPTTDRLFWPFINIIPLQLLGYYVGNLKGVIDIFI